MDKLFIYVPAHPEKSLVLPNTEKSLASLPAIAAKVGGIKVSRPLSVNPRGKMYSFSIGYTKKIQLATLRLTDQRQAESVAKGMARFTGRAICVKEL